MISWKSVKQAITTSCTMHVKFIVCYKTTTQVVWMKNFVSWLNVTDSISNAIKICYDNALVVMYFKNNKSIPTSHFD